MTNPYFDAQSLKQPLEDFYLVARSLIYLRLENRRIAYPPGASVDETTLESAFNMKLRQARAKLEREIRGRVEQPGATPPRGPAS